MRSVRTTEAEFDQFLALPYELPGVEFKGCGRRRERPFAARVVRAVLGMANRRDGGRVILGMPEDNGVLERRGLSDEQLRDWQRYDDIATLLGNFAEPSVRFDLDVFARDGKSYVVIGVDEFDEVPVLCKNDERPGTRPAGEKPVLRRGACYVRSRRKPGTDEVQTYEEMRELLDLATDKGVLRFVERARAAGLDIAAGAVETDRQRFEAKRRDLEEGTER
jgi:predicted HTH transcriptional regulator